MPLVPTIEPVEVVRRQFSMLPETAFGCVSERQRIQVRKQLRHELIGYFMEFLENNPPFLASDFLLGDIKFSEEDDMYSMQFSQRLSLMRAEATIYRKRQYPQAFDEIDPFAPRPTYARQGSYASRRYGNRPYDEPLPDRTYDKELAKSVMALPDGLYF